MDLNLFQNGDRKIIHQFLLSEKSKAVDEFLLSTFDEGIDKAVFFTAEKSQFLNELDAFVTFWSRAYRLLENNEPSLDELENELLSEWLRPDTFVFLPKEITRQDWKNAEARTREIKEVLLEVQAGKYIRCGYRHTYNTTPYNLSDSKTYWGIYKNGRVIEDVAGFHLPLQEEIISAIAMHDEWNDITYLVETCHQYAYFCWGTSA